MKLDDEDIAAFDPETLQAVLARLKAATESGMLTQVFVAWSRGHEIPDDWGQKIYIDSTPVTDLAAPPPPSSTVAPETTAGLQELLL